jgi:nucleotide-binding universal stress UspA family protein
VYKRILVALDGSKFAEEALKHVMNFANPGTLIHLLSVVAGGDTSEKAALASAVMSSPAGEEHWPPVKQPDVNDSAAREKYLHAISSWLEQAGYNVSTEVASGVVIDAIVSAANRGFELVVMTTHQRTGIARVVIGSVAAGVLERVSCPLLIIPPQQ